MPASFGYDVAQHRVATQPRRLARSLWNPLTGSLRVADLPTSRCFAPPPTFVLHPNHSIPSYHPLHHIISFLISTQSTPPRPSPSSCASQPRCGYSNYLSSCRYSLACPRQPPTSCSPTCPMHRLRSVGSLCRIPNTRCRKKIVHGRLAALWTDCTPDSTVSRTPPPTG
jgi:hypothetical protein